MWFPDLFERYEKYELLYPNKEAGICHVSDIVTKYEESKVFKDYCNNNLNNDVFIYTLIIGFSCMPASVFLSVFIKKLGKRTLLGKLTIVNFIINFCLFALCPLNYFVFFLT